VHAEYEFDYVGLKREEKKEKKRKKRTKEVVDKIFS